ncbi:EthD family reductase [Salinisphaera sp. S4-8]|uniref:EthD family reductase n=1 Tax=Salinisphaera sp. S4-8 TaxID=633357 RepID=UPI00333FB0D9
MHALIVTYPKPADAQAFKTYYRDTHIPLAIKLPGLLRYEYAYPDALGAEQPPFFCIWKGYFENEQAMQAALASAEGKALAEDVPNYSPSGAKLSHAEIGGGQP